MKLFFRKLKRWLFRRGYKQSLRKLKDLNSAIRYMRSERQTFFSLGYVDMGWVSHKKLMRMVKQAKRLEEALSIY